MSAPQAATKDGQSQDVATATNGPQDAPTTKPTTATTERKQPPPEKPADITRRSWVVLSFWFIVVCLGLPVWWYTTTIYRAPLPLTEMTDWADGKACPPQFPIRIELDAPGLEARKAENLLRLTQHVLDEANGSTGAQLRLQLRDPEAPSAATASRADPNIALTVQLKPGDTVKSLLHSEQPRLDIDYTAGSVPAVDTTSSPLATYIAAQLQDAFVEEKALISYFLSTSSIPPEQRGQGLAVSDDLAKRMTRTLRYAPTYHITLSLFTSGSTPSGWDIEAALEEHMRPVLEMMSPIHDFTVDTQVQLYANPGVQTETLTKEHLSSFINAAEWPLSPSIGGAPTINFVVFVGNQTISSDPSGSAETTTSRSWLIPQWGSVYLLTPPSDAHVTADQLKQPMLTFTSHLLSLLGTPQSGSPVLRLSSLSRIRSADLMLRASSSLGALARLSLALPSISIPGSVADGVAKSLQHLEQACANLGGVASLQHARVAEAEAERAFFEKSMVGQLYFPDEHKVAVYLPLLGPVGVPLLMGLVNELKAWKLRRSLKAKTT